MSSLKPPEGVLTRAGFDKYSAQLDQTTDRFKKDLKRVRK